MKQAFLLISILINCRILFPAVSFFTYTGTINEDIPVTVFLEFHDSSVEGLYFYNNNRKLIKLKGEFFGTRLELKEYYDKNHTGTFEGRIAQDKISGEWKSPDNSRTLTFELSEYRQQSADFQFDGEPIHPGIIEQLVIGQPYEVADLSKDETRGELSEGGTTVSYPDDSGMRSPYCSYELLGSIDNLFFLNSSWNGGGTSIFDNLIVVNRVNEYLFIVETIATRDRSFWGISKATKQGEKILYSQRVSALDMAGLTDIPETELIEFGDLDNSESDFYGYAQFEFDISSFSSEFTGFSLLDGQMDTDIPAETYAYQGCFNEHYNSYINRTVTELDREGFDVFIREFTQKCITNTYTGLGEDVYILTRDLGFDVYDWDIETHVFEVLDIDWGKGLIAFRHIYRLPDKWDEEGNPYEEAVNCGYTGMSKYPYAAVVLGIYDVLDLQYHKVWTIYSSVYKENDCMSYEESKQNLDEAKAYFKSLELDIEKKPEYQSFSEPTDKEREDTQNEKGYLLGSAVLSPENIELECRKIQTTQEDDPVDGYAYGTLYVDGNPVFSRKQEISLAGVGGGTVKFVSVFRKDNKIILLEKFNFYRAMTGDAKEFYSFSPILELPAK